MICKWIDLSSSNSSNRPMGCAYKESQYQHAAYKKNETLRSVHQELLTKNLNETLHCTPEFTLRKSRSCCCSWQRALSCAICDFSCSTCLQVDGRQLQNSDKRKSRIITQIDRGDISRSKRKWCLTLSKSSWSLNKCSSRYSKSRVPYDTCQPAKVDAKIELQILFSECHKNQGGNCRR